MRSREFTTVTSFRVYTGYITVRMGFAAADIPAVREELIRRGLNPSRRSMARSPAHEPLVLPQRSKGNVFERSESSRVAHGVDCILKAVTLAFGYQR